MNGLKLATVYKFNIPFDLGIGYAKVIDFSERSPYFGITVKIFDYFESKEISDVKIFGEIPLFMNPIPIVKPPSIRGKFKWQKIGTLLGEDDSDIPMYKEYIYDGFAWSTIEEYQSRQWNVRLNLTEKIGPLNFDQVRHLEELFWRSTVTIEERVAMQLLRYKGVDVKDFFTKNVADDSWIVDYNTQQFIPLYKTIPEPIRGKPLIKGYVPDEYLDWKWE